MSITETAPVIPEGSWGVDTVHSSIRFAVTYNGFSRFSGHFTSYDVTLVGGTEPRLFGTVSGADIQIEDDVLKGVVLGEEFFDVESHPNLSFRSTTLTLDPAGDVELKGELSIRGQEVAIVASGRYAEIGAGLNGKERIGLTLSAAIDRRDFGLNWDRSLPGGARVLDFDVALDAQFELTRI